MQFTLISLFPPAFHCSMALGMESGKISDDQITASTTFYDNRWLPRQARLNNNDNAWTPSEDSNKEYIQVRLYLGHYIFDLHFFCCFLFPKKR